MKLNYKKIFFVGVAFFLISLFWQTYDSVITKILIDKFGLSQTWSGVIMALDNIFALFLLPLFGGLSDKTKTKFGKRTPYIFFGTIVAALAFVALSFADNYQTVRIETQTTIVEDYDAALAKKDVMLDSILDKDGKTAALVAFEKAQTDFNAGTMTQEDYDAAVLAYAEWTADWPTVMAEWSALNVELLAAKQAAFNAGEITQAAYDRWYANTYNEMVEIPWRGVAAGGLTQTQYSYWADEIYDGVYDANLSAAAWEMTAANPFTFIVFIVLLLIALISMATFRSPAVALMPDVTMKPLRSKANAIINLMGAFGGIMAIAILGAFALDNRSYVKYFPAFVIVGVLMLVLLGLFLWKVKEPQLVAEKEADDVKFGLTEEDELKESGETMQELSREKRNSLYLILASVFLWFLGYNAVTTKLSDYAPKVLGMGYSMPLLIAQGAAILAFVPIGFLATKIGRRKTILIGITILSVCFGSVFFITETTSSFMYIVFAMTGIGWATINVNSYPMVVELSKGSNIGRYTGYYYTFSMAAQILTPILSGILMDIWGRKILFPYATLFVALAFITMFFVKHGDAKVIDNRTTLEKLGQDMD
jgi:Na+/melibiose symporter-like transporter